MPTYDLPDTDRHRAGADSVEVFSFGGIKPHSAKKVKSVKNVLSYPKQTIKFFVNSRLRPCPVIKRKMQTDLHAHLLLHDPGLVSGIVLPQHQAVDGPVHSSPHIKPWYFLVNYSCKLSCRGWKSMILYILKKTGRKIKRNFTVKIKTCRYIKEKRNS